MNKSLAAVAARRAAAASGADSPASEPGSPAVAADQQSHATSTGQSAGILRFPSDWHGATLRQSSPELHQQRTAPLYHRDHMWQRYTTHCIAPAFWLSSTAGTCRIVTSMAVLYALACDQDAPLNCKCVAWGILGTSIRKQIRKNPSDVREVPAGGSPSMTNGTARRPSADASPGAPGERPTSPSSSGENLQKRLAALADLALQLGPTVGGPSSAALNDAIAAVGMEVCLRHSPDAASVQGLLPRMQPPLASDTATDRAVELASVFPAAKSINNSSRPETIGPGGTLVIFGGIVI